jgi:hypothetical protein
MWWLDEEDEEDATINRSSGPLSIEDLSSKHDDKIGRQAAMGCPS